MMAADVSGFFILGAFRAFVGWTGACSRALASLAPMAVATSIGGIPSLTAVLVISTGIFGAAFARVILNTLRVSEPEAMLTCWL